MGKPSGLSQTLVHRRPRNAQRGCDRGGGGEADVRRVRPVRRVRRVRPVRRVRRVGSDGAGHAVTTALKPPMIPKRQARTHRAARHRLRFGQKPPVGHRLGNDRYQRIPHGTDEPFIVQTVVQHGNFIREQPGVGTTFVRSSANGTPSVSARTTSRFSEAWASR